MISTPFAKFAECPKRAAITTTPHLQKPPAPTRQPRPQTIQSYMLRSPGTFFFQSAKLPAYRSPKEAPPTNPSRALHVANTGAGNFKATGGGGYCAYKPSQEFCFWRFSFKVCRWMGEGVHGWGIYLRISGYGNWMCLHG